MEEFRNFFAEFVIFESFIVTMKAKEELERKIIGNEPSGSTIGIFGECYMRVSCTRFMGIGSKEGGMYFPVVK